MVKMYLSPLPLNVVLDILANAVRQERQNKRYMDCERRCKTVQRRHDRLYREWKTLMKELELIRHYRKVAGYKINTQKPIAFLYNSLEQVETEIWSSTLLIIPTKVKYSGTNLIKCALDLYGENYKILIKEIKELDKWRDIPFCG